MNSNEIMSEQYEKQKELNIENSPCYEENVDMCTYQYYCPQPIMNARLAHAYVPFQYLCCLYAPEKGLEQGTIFPELNRPYRSNK